MNELNLALFITNLCIAAFIGVLLPILPILTRKSFLFGVKVPIEAQATDEAKGLKRNYITVCIIGSVVLFALIIAQYVIAPDMTLLAVMYFPLLFVLLQAIAYIPNWKRAGVLKEKLGWEAPSKVFADTKTSHSRGNMSQMPWGWYIVSLILIIASIIITLIEYQRLPDMIPTHFDINMQPDAWREKSYMTVLLTPLINLAMLAVMWVTGFMYIRAKLQIDPQNPQLSFAQHTIYRRRMGHGIGFMALSLVIMLAGLGFLSIWEDLPITMGMTIWIPLIGTVPLVAVSVISGQGGCKIKPKDVDVEAVEGVDNKAAAGGSAAAYGRLDDKRWALGLFYHNPDDPAILVEDRFGNNLGFNYSRLPVKIFVAIGALLLIGMYVWVTVYAIGLPETL